MKAAANELPPPSELNCVEVSFPTTSQRDPVQSERHALARALHETICQSLSGIQLLVRVIERKAVGEVPGMARDFSELRRTIAAASAEVHQLVRTLQAKETSDADRDSDYLP